MNIRRIISVSLVVATLALALPWARASETVTFTVDASALRYPFTSPSDNQVALTEMLEHATIVGHYWKSTKVLEMARCMTGVTCYPSPHLEDELKDFPVTVRPQVVLGTPGIATRLMFDLPVSRRGASLDGVSLVLPLKFLWQQTSAQLALKRAEAALPDYAKSRHALESDASVSINLEMPQTLGEPSPTLDHCAGIPNPLSWSSSGVVSISTLARLGSKRTPSWSQTPANRNASRLGTEEQCESWRPDVENTYLWRAQP